MRIQLTIIVSLVAIGFASASLPQYSAQYLAGYAPVGDLYMDSDDAYSTAGVYAGVKGPGGNSACPNEPIRFTLEGTLAWTLCCENEIKVILSGITGNSTEVPPKCCGPNPYSPVDKFCCGGVLNPVIPTSACCKGAAYDRREFVCCNDQLVNLTQAQKDTGGVFECCGAKPSYSSSGYSQYSGVQQYATQQVPMPMRMKRNAPYYGVGSYGQYAQQYQGSYQDKFINILEQICCSGIPRNLTGTVAEKAQTSCCGNQIFNHENQACCGSVIVDRTPGSNFQSCCGADLFNPSTELCCINKKFALLSAGGSVQKCCAGNSYEPLTQKCCAGYIVNVTNGEYNYNAKCCGINLYDAASQICCSGVPVKMLLNVPIAYQRCCGFEVYDRTQWTCCNQESKVPKGKKCSYY